jgi:DNA replication and repair protein RecF
VFVSRLRLVNFRSYCDAVVAFGPGLNVVVGANATGKTNLLEGAWYALRGASPRTRREEKLVLWGARFSRVELTLEDEFAPPAVVELGYAPREGKRMRWSGVEVGSLEDLRDRTQVSIFVPESLLLVKGSPARRRAHLDTFASILDKRYAAAAREMREALRQRNAQLAAVKGGAPESSLDAWDTQFARAAAELGRRRRDLVSELGGRFAPAAAALAPEGEAYDLQLVTQLQTLGFDLEALREELRRRRPGEIRRGLSLFGPHRDDVRFFEVASGTPRTGGPSVQTIDDAGIACAAADLPPGGRDLRLFGSQGEQRLAVLALLLAEQELTAERTGATGTLFLDDVMSELDDTRRRLLVRKLSAAGQAIITTTNREYFTKDELAGATLVELPLPGSQQAPVPDTALGEAAGPAPPEMDAL